MAVWARIGAVVLALLGLLRLAGLVSFWAIAARAEISPPLAWPLLTMALPAALLFFLAWLLWQAADRSAAGDARAAQRSLRLALRLVAVLLTLAGLFGGGCLILLTGIGYGGFNGRIALGLTVAALMIALAAWLWRVTRPKDSPPPPPPGP